MVSGIPIKNQKQTDESLDVGVCTLKRIRTSSIEPAFCGSRCAELLPKYHLVEKAVD